MKRSPLLRLLLLNKEFYPVIVVYSISISLLTLGTPISVQSLVNTFTFGPYFQPLFFLSLCLAGILIVLGTLKIMQYLLVEYLQRRLFTKVTAVIARAYILALDNEDRTLENKANRYFDVVLAMKTLAVLVTDGIALVLQAGLGVILISLYHPWFIVLSILILACILLPLYFLLGPGMHNAREESNAKYDLADYLHKLSQGQFPLSDRQKLLESADTEIGQFLQRRQKHFRILFSQNLIYILVYGAINTLLLALGGYLVISGQLSVGQLVAAEIVVNAILSQLLYAIKYLDSYYDLYTASWKLSLFFDVVDKYKDKGSPSTVAQIRSTEFFNRFKSVRTIYYPKNYRRLARNYFTALVVLGFLFAILPWQQTSTGTGKVTALDPNDRTQEITATVSGLVEEWLVQDGQEVKKGDPLVKVADNDPDYLLRLESQRDAAVKKFEAAKSASDIARLNFHRQEKLVKEGLSSQKEFEQSNIHYKKLLAEEAGAAAELAKSEVELSRQQLQIVTAPRDGRILRILRGSGTTTVKVGDPLVLFVPNTSQTIAEVFVVGNDLPLIYPGREVRLQFEGWPAIQFSGWPSIAIGSFGGIVSAVDPSISQDGRFRILVVPDPKDPNPWPDHRILRQGARTVALVLLDQVSLGYELWRQMNGFPKSLNAQPEMLKMEKKP